MKRFWSLLCVFALLACALCGCTQQDVRYDQNLIVNGGVMTEGENGMPEGWQYVAYENNTAVALADVQDGAAHLVHYASNDSRFVQTVETAKNTIYRISAQVRARNVAGLDYGAGLSVRDTFIASEQVYDTDGAWRELTLYVNSADQTQLGIELRLGFFSNDAMGEAWFKDVTVCAVEAAPQGASVYQYQAIDSANSSEQSGVSDHVGAWLLVLALAMLAFVPLAGRLFARKPKGTKPYALDSVTVWLIAAMALLTRLALAVAVPGYQVDISCFTGWSEHLYQVGPMQFYQTVSFCDYPPGYLYILWFIALLRRVLGVGIESALYLLLLKLPAILCDVAAGLVLLKLLRLRVGDRAALIGACFYWFNPATLINSACWGQIDAILVLGLLLMLMYLLKGSLLRASLCFAVSVLIKPQALMAGPLLLFAFIDDIIRRRGRGWMELATDFLICAALCLAAVLPFWGSQEPLWIVEKYLATMSSYTYATVNAMNLFALFGGNWVDQTASLFGPVTYQMFGTAMMVLSLVYAAVLFLKKRDLRALPICGAIILCGVFVLGVRMHERYLFPALMMLLLAWGLYGDIRLMHIFVLFSASQFINVSLVLAYTHLLEGQQVATIVFSLINLGTLAYFCYTAWDICLRGRCVLPPQEKNAGASQRDDRFLTLNAPQDGARGKITRFDALAMSIVTVVYAVFALINLGDTHAPITTYTATAQQESVVFSWEGPFELNRFVYYGGISDGIFHLEGSADGETWAPLLLSADGGSYSEGQVVYALNTMFEWHEFDVSPCSVTQVRLTFESAGISLIEVGFWDAQGQVRTPVSAQAQGARVDTYDAAALVDEQQEIPARRSYLNSMYFDEIYHARTAYEHVTGMEWYETTHPPLGKALMSLCIMAFGMTPFAWRLAGTLAGIFMLPGMYMTAKLLFKRSRIALMAMLLLTFDCMHYTQTRIATIDSFAVLFIIWMFYFMMRYVLLHNFNHEKLSKTLPCLLASGVMMGLGIASKWIGMYAGAGLAVTFFYCLYLRWRESRISAKTQGGAVMKAFWKNALLTCAFCVLAFLVIPALIYMASYTQYFMIRGGKTLADWWEAQQYMFNYHSKLVDSHPYASPWYEWPLIIRPMWYYKGNHDGWIATINAMGNPAVWWVGLAAMLWLIGRKCAGKARNLPATLLIIGVAAQFLPWVLVPRSTFIYHYFASVPFIIWAICYFVSEHFENADPAGRKKLTRACVGYLAVALALFVFFYPAISGVDMPVWYAQLLRWMPTWTIWAY
jgi:dolichyl-phosphate-mannose-protein mannosyltransferase